MLDTDLLRQRKIGVLPEIDIAGQVFTIDLRLNELRNTQSPDKRLGLDEMVTAKDGQHYLFFFDRENQSILHASPDLLKIPENTVLMKIPDELGLDPVGMARRYGLGDEYFLKMHPYDGTLKGKVVPLDKSGLPEYVARNQQEQQGLQKKQLRKLG
ncbi:hypothetical protein [uncultured Algoriphagus sp.]|uniref:hypothetical protein n=1 Tax=uncultured Algoriphagus sp. TaxID=417365 RepID=UPI0030EDDAD3|tara:strand:+ start:11369 stop:11836 length:468 start_codon:yes stop_codon:yes gene_type:complete